MSNVLSVIINVLSTISFVHHQPSLLKPKPIGGISDLVLPWVFHF